MKTSLAMFVFLTLIISGCTFCDIDCNCPRGSEISIYLVKEGQISYSNTDVNLNEVDLEESPWLKSSDIDFYDWSAQVFYLNKELSKEPYAKRYFVLKADRQPLFIGYFFPSYQSSIPQVPCIIAADDFFHPSDVVGLNGFGFSSLVEPLSENEKFREALINSGLYREGIDVILLDVVKKNSSTVIYKYKIENKDHSKIYVMDPDKMGNSRFHYYTNGVTFRKGSSYFFAENKSVTSSEIIKDSWYYGLRPGGSITRSVELDGFRNLPEGTFICNFDFEGANLKKGEWKKRDGRIWLGSIRTEKEMSFR